MTLLSEIESASHLLLWARHTDTGLQLVRVDLPRLNTSFVPHAVYLDGSTVVRLRCCDCEDLFLAPGQPLALGTASLAVSGSVLLENAAGEQFVMVANHKLARPQAKSIPFHSEVTQVRGDPSWLEHMQAGSFKEASVPLPGYAVTLGSEDHHREITTLA